MSKVIEALKKLDPNNNNQWTKDGAPVLVAVRFLAGDQKLTQEALDAACAETGCKRPTLQDAINSILPPTETSNATPPVDGDAGLSAAQGEQGASEDRTATEALATARERLARAQARKEEADREFNAATKEVDDCIIAVEKDSPADGLPQVLSQYQKAQQEARDKRAARIQEMASIPLRDILPQVRSPLDAAYGAKKGRSAPTRT